MRSFGSDNHSGIHPQIMQAIVDANVDHAPAYGDDWHTDRVNELMRGLFGERADSYIVFSGTGANVLALRTLTRPYNAIICPATAHINENEGGAPEFHTGCKLLAVDTPDGKLTPDMVRPWLHQIGNPQRVQPKVISITQPTELGTLYTCEEIRVLADIAHENGMYLHVDGARFGNAVAALGVTPREMITDTGVDALSFGGTKNGLMLGEVVVFLNSEISQGAKYERKQLMQLESKMRYIAVQFEAYLKGDLWLEIGRHCNKMGSLLASKVAEIKGVKVLHKVEANAVFVQLPMACALKIRESNPFNITPGDPCEARWLCSFDTTEDDIERFVAELKRAVEQAG